MVHMFAFQPGMTIHARITKIDIERFHVELTSKSSDLTDTDGQYKPAKDLYYDAGAFYKFVCVTLLDLTCCVMQY